MMHNHPDAVWREHKDGWIRDLAGDIVMSAAAFHNKTKKLRIITKHRPYFPWGTIFDPLKFMPNTKRRVMKSHKVY